MTIVRNRDLLVSSRKTPDADGRIVNITPESAGWRHVGFQVFRLSRGQRVQGQTLGEEACVVILSGRCSAQAAGQKWAEIGARATPFDGPPHALYLPVGTDYHLEATSDSLEFAIGTGPVANPTEERLPRLITPGDVRVSTRGRQHGAHHP